VRGIRGTRGKGGDRLGGRASLRVVVGCGNGMMVDAPFTGAFVRIDSMYQPGGLIGAVRPAG